MFKQFRTVSMFLLLLGGFTGVVCAASPDVAGVYATQQSGVKVQSTMLLGLLSVPLW